MVLWIYLTYPSDKKRASGKVWAFQRNLDGDWTNTLSHLFKLDQPDFLQPVELGSYRSRLSIGASADIRCTSSFPGRQ